MEYISNDGGSSRTYYLLFSSVFFLLLFTTLAYKTPITYFEYLKGDNLNRLWGIHSSHNPQNSPTTSRWPVGGPFSPTDSLQCPLARLLMFLTLFLIDYSILRDDSLYVFSLIFVSHFNLLPFCFSEIKKRGSISVFSSY